MWGISNFVAVKNAEKLNCNRQLNPSNQPGSKFSILLFHSVEFREIAASAGQAYLLFLCSRRFQPSCPEAALPFTNIHHTLIWLEWLSTAQFRAEMVIKSDISYAPVSVKAYAKFHFLHWSRKLMLFFLLLILSNFAISPKFLCWLLLEILFFNSFLTFSYLPCLS